MQKGDGQVIWFVHISTISRKLQFPQLLKNIIPQVSFYEHVSLFQMAAWPWRYFIIMHTLSQKWNVSYVVYFKKKKNDFSFQV